MKRLVLGAIIVVFCTAVVFAQTYANGIYFAQDADFTNNQKNQVVVTVSGGRITAANWNVLSLNAGAQDLKSIAAAPGASAAVNTWATQTKAAEDFLVSSQNVNATSVTNGPANVAPFFNLVRRALGGSPVAKGSYNKDGWYSALAAAADEYHTRDFVLITVVNGTIVDVLWNGVLVGFPPSINTSKIIQSMANNNRGYPMTGARSPWHTQAISTAAELVKAQSPDNIKMKADNKHPDAISGVTIEIDGFLAVSRQALQSAR